MKLIADEEADFTEKGKKIIKERYKK